MDRAYTPRDYANDPQLDGSDDSPPPRLKYLLLSTQRSGSNYLCRNLSMLGLGVPIEYFNPIREQDLWRRWNVCRFDRDYVELLFKRRSPNGIFGMKVQARELTEHFDLVRSSFSPNVTRIVMLLRSDIRRQARSLHKALRTGQWWHTDEVTTLPQDHIPKNDPEHIERCKTQILEDELCLREFVFNARFKTICMFYENFEEDLGSTVMRILKFLGEPEMFDPAKLIPFIEKK